MARGVSLTPEDYEVGYSGDLSSEQISTVHEKIRDDLLESHRREKELRARLFEQQTANTLGQNVINSRISELNLNAQVAASSYSLMASGVYEAIALGYMTDDNYPSLVWHNDFYNTNNIVFQGLGTYTEAEVEDEYGQLVLPAIRGRNWSHLPQVLNEDGEYVASPYVRLALNDQAEELARTRPEYHIVGDNTRTWIEEYQVQTTKTIYIHTPQGGRPILNHVAILPWPPYFLDVLEFKYHNGTGWVDIPTFPRPSLTSRNLSMHFDGQNFTGRRLLITLRSGENGGYYYNAVQQVFADYREYESESRLYFHYIADTPGVTHITGINLQYQVYPASLELGVSYNPVDLRIVRGSAITAGTDEAKRQQVAQADINSGLVFSTLVGNTYFTREDTPLDITVGGEAEQDIYTEMILRKVGGTTPVVDYITIHYKYDK